MGETLFLIDGHATIYRAYFAIKSRLSAPGTGTPTNAAFGFTRMLRALIAKDAPDYLAVAMDSPGPTFRHEVYDKYKSSRPGMPEDMVPQIGMVERVCEAYRIPVYRVPRFEADDILGTLAMKAAERGLHVVIVTGDKDLLQLVGEHGKGSISWFDPQKEKLLDAAGVERERGVSPEQIVDLLGLAGDSSDDIPGVPGVGPKTALALLKKYGTLEGTLAAAAEGKEKGKRGKNLVAFAEQARLSMRLATISYEAPTELDLEACRLGEGDSEMLTTIFQELGFRVFLKDVVPRV